MSVWKPESWVDGVYVGASVWWSARNDDGLNGAGIIFGFIWDQMQTGVVVQFPQTPYVVRYFIPFEALEEYWNQEGKMFVIQDAKFLGLVPERDFLLTHKVRSFHTVKHNRQRVPVWTQLR